ncbi:uncharacterized protein TNCV_4768591 [Trichonephila clavipes]|nr:uncharacterized protein TNCV_4768591 [Trichonephila clavipes]
MPPDRQYHQIKAREIPHGKRLHLRLSLSLALSTIQATDKVILNYGQVTRTTPELAPPVPNNHTSPKVEKSSQPNPLERNNAIMIKIPFREVHYYKVGLYLTIFERQAKFLNIPEKTWTAYLIGSLPPDIAQLIAREDEDDAQNYEKIKRKTPANIKEHLLDIWADLNDPLELAEQLDAYDNLRPGMKSNSNQTFNKKEEFRKHFPLKKNQPVGGSHDNHSPGPSRTVPRFPSNKTEGRNPIKCYGCGTPGVVKSKCPKCSRAN